MTAPIDWPAWEQRFIRFLADQSADPAHDLTHVRRVVGNTLALAAAEGSQLEIVLPAAWLHDCVTVPKDSPLRARASTLAATSAGDFLQECGYPRAYLPAIRHAIEAHSFSAGITPRTLEAMVVQDADRLDALGAVGIARCLMLGGALGKALYDHDAPFPQQRPADDTRNVIDHFYVKLLKLADTMHTRAGKAEAVQRTIFMHEFLRQLGHEIGASHRQGSKGV
jgi:uncharacterized protein